MSGLTNDKRASLVAALRFDAGRADDPDPRRIFPVPEHVRALESDVSLIVGDRGAGKTRLVQALSDDDVRAALVRRSPSVRAPQGKVSWAKAWPLGRDGPDHGAWRAFASGRSRDDAMSVWFAYLVKVLRTDLETTAPPKLQALIAAGGLDAAGCLEAYRKCALEATAALDRLDERLEQAGEWRFIAYDELDVLVFDDWPALGTLIRGLVSFWAAYARRWRRIRPKVFLRSDFYEHHGEIAGADVAKLAASRVELRWSDKNLYGALLQHVLNKRDASGGQPLFDHFRSAVSIDSDPVLGHVPKLSQAKDAKLFVDRIVSEYMGKNRSKGLAFTWLLDHLRDGNDRVIPRTLVWLIELAAEKEDAKPRATGAHLLHHTSIRLALDDVSERYVQHAKTNEFRWLGGLAERLGQDREVPWPRKDLLRLLDRDFGKSWASEENIDPPGASADELLESLIELGIVRERKEGQYDVPDLYLDGLGLTRRGGVAKA